MIREIRRFLALAAVLCVATSADAAVRRLGEDETPAPGLWTNAAAGDYVLESARARFVVESSQHPHGIAATGGQLIDAELPGGSDALGMLHLLLSRDPIDGVAYDTMYVIGSGEDAGVRARGTSLRYYQLLITTDYRMVDAGAALEITTWFHNQSAEAREIAPLERIYLGGTRVVHLGPVDEWGDFGSGGDGGQRGAILLGENVAYRYHTVEAPRGFVELSPTSDAHHLDARHSGVTLEPHGEFMWKRRLVPLSPSDVERIDGAPGRAPEPDELSPAAGFETDLGAPPRYAALDVRAATAASLGGGGSAETVAAAGMGAGLDAMVIADLNTIGSPLASPGIILFTGVLTESPGVGRFLAFPAAARPWQKRCGAPETVGATPEYLFPALRALDQRALLVVVDGRARGSGYFNRMRVDPNTGRSRHFDYDDSFDAIEILSARDPAQFEPLMRDWFNLLNAGRRVVAVGGSGCEEADGPEAGAVRTFIDLRGAEIGSSSTSRREEERGQVVLANLLHEGRAIVSSGLFVSVMLDRKWGPGDLARPNVASSHGSGQVEVVVSGPAWASCDSVRLHANGKVVASAWVRPGARLIRGEKSRIEFDLPMSEDTWIVAEARGGEYTKSVFPRAEARGLTPIGLSNPIYVDVDGDGEFREQAAR